MKHIIMSAVLVAVALTSNTASAEVNVDIGIGTPGIIVPAPVYVEPARVYYPSYVNDRHHSYDWSYWHPRREVVVVKEEHEYRHDNGKHKGHYKHGGDRD